MLIDKRMPRTIILETADEPPTISRLHDDANFDRRGQAGRI